MPMLYTANDVDPLMLSIHATIVINEVQSSLQKRRVTEDEYRDALVLRAYYLGLQYPGCSFDPFSESKHPYKDELTRSFHLGTGTVDSNVPKLAVIH